MNILLIAAAILLLICVIGGYQNGMVKQAIALVSLIIFGVTAALLTHGWKSYVDGQFLNVIFAAVLLLLIGLLRHLLTVVFLPAKWIAKLPIVSWLNQVAGIVFGALEAVFLLWLVYTFVMMLDLGMVGEQIKFYTRESEILAWLYKHNYLAYLIEQFLENFK